MKQFREKCWILYGFKFKKIIYGYQKYESEGTISSVDFDWEKALYRRKYIVGFNHTHPGGLNSPSSTDDLCMTGWVKTLGKPLICGIIGNDQKIYIYKRMENNIIHYYNEESFKKIGNFFIIKVAQ